MGDAVAHGHRLDGRRLYLWHNATGGTQPPNDGSVVATQLSVLINATGNQSQPVVGIAFAGIGFRDSAPFFLGPHGTPAGGDWAIERSAALFFEGTVGTTLSGCLLTTLDGNGVFFSGYTRNATVTQVGARMWGREGRGGWLRCGGGMPIRPVPPRRASL